MQNNLKPAVGLGVIIFNNDDKILLGKRIVGHGRAQWAPPGGHLEFGESFESCAIREVLEETGLQILDPKFLAVTNDFFSADNKHYISIFMIANCQNDQQIMNKEPHKTAEWNWFKLNELPEELFLPLKQLVMNKGYGIKLAVEYISFNYSDIF